MPESKYIRKLVAILSADSQDYSRLMGQDEADTARSIRACFEIMSELVGSYRGRVVDCSGDNLLAELPSVVDAVQCAVAIQEKLKSRNETLPADRRMVFRIGINLGDVLEEDGRLYGEGVNVASRIEQLADGGDVCISGTAFDQVRNKLPLGYESLGEQKIKNILGPVRAYRVLPEASGPTVRRARRTAPGRWRSALVATVPGVIVAAFAVFLWNTYLKPAPFPARIVGEKPPGLQSVADESAIPGSSDRKIEPTTADPRVSAGKPQSRSPSQERSVAARSVENPRPRRPAGKANPERLPGVPLPEQPSIAVLPFENLSGDSEQEHLSDGLTDDIITTLSKLPRLFVISKSSTQRYKGKPAKVEQISRDLGVRYVLEGSLQRSDHRIRVNAQLLDGASGRHVWAERYDRAVGDLFRTRDQLVLEIAAAMAGKLTDGDVAVISRRNTNSLEAWEAFQRARALYERYTPEDNRRAREWYRKAVSVDPKYVNAWMNIGLTYIIEGRSFLTGEEREQAFASAIEIADKVVEMDPSYYGSYFLRANVFLRQGRHDEALANGRRAFEMEPNSTNTAAMLAAQLTYAGQPEEAIPLFQKAMRLSPYYRPWYLDGLGLAYHLTGETDKAIESFKVSAQRDPKAVYPHLRLAMIYAEQGRDDEMRAEAAEIRRLNPKFSIESWAKVHSFKDPTIHEYRKTLMIKAGLPE